MAFVTASTDPVAHRYPPRERLVREALTPLRPAPPRGGGGAPEHHLSEPTVVPLPPRVAADSGDW